MPLLYALFDLGQDAPGRYIHVNQSQPTNLTLAWANIVVLVLLVAAIVFAMIAPIPRRMVR